ncbi:MAG: cupin domain-containing protein [Nitrospira sp.]|nr:cupin domain-containing protein [Nitrospira sp.]MDH4303806.1 cupin domain-containing protein [Nitrospira sp.]MDH5195528.1 cupin domain-containing protein [Nitrospira sp.]
MTSHQVPQELEEQAAAYVLGILTPEDRVVFEKRLCLSKNGLEATTQSFQAVVEQLGFGVPAIEPSAALRERVLAQVGREAAQEEQTFQSMVDHVAFAASPVAPPASLRDRLLDQVRYEAHPPRQTITPLTFVRASEGEWIEMAPGVTAKVLYLDPVSRRATALVRMTPGSAYAPHRHAEPEERYVLEGGCFCGGQELVVGDYHRAEAGTEHHDTSSDTGCLLLIISSPQNEMLS